MRKFIDILNSVFSEDDKDSYVAPAFYSGRRQSLMESVERLEEATNYQQMFDPVLSNKDQDVVAELSNQIKNLIKWARQHLKREDRIVWYLRIARLVMLNDEQQKKEEARLIENGGQSEYLHWSSYFNTNMGRQEISHFFDMPIKHIIDYRFGWQSPELVLDLFRKYEAEWKESNTPDDESFPLDPESEKIIHSFPDGFHWVMLNRGGCRKEANAMGHCGNGSGRQGQHLLSLRKLITMPNGDKYWRPSLTFILEEDGFLGEMKGRGNQKPSEKYHPHIVELLKKTSLVKGIRGGGYLKENNFSMADLSEDRRQELYNINPELMGPLDYYKKMGITPDLIRKTADLLGVSPHNVQLDKTGATIKTFFSFEDFVEEWCGKDANRNMEFEPYFSSSDVSNDDIEGLVDSLPSDLIKKIISELEPMMSSDDLDDYDLDRSSDLVKMMEEYDSEYYSILAEAVARGLESGAESEHYKAYSNLLTSDFELWVGDKKVKATLYDKNGGPPDRHGGEIMAKIPIIDYLWWAEHGEDDGDLALDDTPDIDVPHYGWSDYDENSAIEYAKEMIPIESE